MKTLCWLKKTSPLFKVKGWFHVVVWLNMHNWTIMILTTFLCWLAKVTLFCIYKYIVIVANHQVFHLQFFNLEKQICIYIYIFVCILCKYIYIYDYICICLLTLLQYASSILLKSEVSELKSPTICTYLAWILTPFALIPYNNLTQLVAMAAMVNDALEAMAHLVRWFTY
jgi:hypothetical protein